MKDRPRVAIVHYHLRRGGVTRVIETAGRELRRLDVPVVVLSGEPPETAPAADAVPVCVVPALGYDEHASCDAAAVRSLTRTLTAQAATALDGVPDVWHFHNHALGKNPAVTCLAATLAREGVAVLLQCHDFAEEQRPGNWRLLVETVGAGSADGLDAALYPLATHARMAVLNARDRRILLQAGAPPEMVMTLPNPVVPPVTLDQAASAMAADADAPRHWVYLTRAIRRKNLGEFILWAAQAAALGSQDDFKTTLAPTHPRDQIEYLAWQRLAALLKLPVCFGVGLDGARAFQLMLQQATGLATTSVAEGFGLAFLEPWLLGRSVVGRRLPEITPEMEHAGIDLSILYDRLEVPLEWVGRQTLFDKLKHGLNRTYRDYGMCVPDAAAERAMDAIVRSEGVDFGGLDEALQRRIVRRVAGSRADAAALRPTDLAPDGIAAATIARNRERVLSVYAPAAYGARLLALYTELLDSAGGGGVSFLSAAAVLKQFLCPERFRLLRMEG